MGKLKIMGKQKPPGGIQFDRKEFGVIPSCVEWQEILAILQDMCLKFRDFKCGEFSCFAKFHKNLASFVILTLV